MALPVDVTDPGSSNAELQAFGLGLPALVNAGNVVAQQFASASAVNAGTSRVGGPASSAQAGLGIAVDVNDPGSFDVADGPVLAIGLPAQVQGGSGKPGLGVAATVTDPGNSDAEEISPIGLGLPPLVSGDASRPGRTPTEVTANNVAGQVFGGTGLPANVFV